MPAPGRTRYRDAVSTPPTPIPEITAEEADQLLASGAFLLDVREDEEWAAGHAPAAVHIPMGAVAERTGEIPGGQVVVCICRAGGRSLTVANVLAELGFEVRNLTGGMQAWESTGRPVVTVAGDAGRVV
jgi:rhodanese-related sulfurtransferase